MIPQPIFGPSLSIGGHTAQWNGRSSQGVAGQVGVACRVIFEANVGDRVTSHLNICNDGTTAIYFSWKVRMNWEYVTNFTKAKISWCTILKSKQYDKYKKVLRNTAVPPSKQQNEQSHKKGLLSHFHVNGHALGPGL